MIVFKALGTSETTSDLRIICDVMMWVDFTQPSKDVDVGRSVDEAVRLDQVLRKEGNECGENDAEPEESRWESENFVSAGRDTGRQLTCFE